MDAKRSIVPGVLLMFALLPVQAGASDFYVSPNGSSGGSGSIGSPWDLATALAQPAAVRPGDTIWLRGGTYSGSFTANLNGSSSAPIIVRQYPGERAIIDGASDSMDNTLTVWGSYTWYWGFEVTNSNPQRSLSTGSVRGSALVIEATNSKFINMVVHDGGQGFSFWTPAVNSELYGNLIYYNGFDLPDRGHGHGIYAQNNTGVKTIADNIIFDQYGWGIHVYTETGSINNFNIDGNISFNNGSVSFSGYTNNILVGGLTVAQNNNITNNYTYYTPSVGTGYNNIGYSAGCTNTTVNNNYFASGYFAISLPNCVPVQMTGNTFYGITPGWIYGAYPNNVITGTRPTGTAVFVRPNKYEAGRGNIVIFNWALQSTVNVDLSPLGLVPGTSFEIHDAENFFGPSIVAGTYTGAPVSIPMTGLRRAAPVGNVDTVPAHTAPEFGTFVVLPGSSGTTSSVVVNIIPTTVSLGPSKTQQFTATVLGSANQAVTWSLNPLVGSISSTGLYTAPGSITSSQQVQVIATSAADLTKSTAVLVTLQPPPTATAQFVAIDSTTQGNWKSFYGADGFNVIGDAASSPSYLILTPSGTASWTWAGSTSDPRGLQKNSGSDRIAATWYTSSSYTIDININDGKSHQLAVYCLDWDRASRIETLDIIDAGTGIVLDSRSISNFSNGQYLIWNISGHIILRVGKNSGVNAVISGLFFGGVPAPVPPPPIPPPGGTAAAPFVKSDAASQGNWKGVYGADGYNVIGDASSFTPAYASVTPSGNLYWLWSGSTGDSRALQMSGSGGRVSGTWYSASSFTVDINVTDGVSHQIALYFVDYDFGNRTQTVEILDAQSGATLDSHTITNFSGGQYLVWNISGHVVFRINHISGPNAVLSGLFFGSAGRTSASAQFIRSDTTTAGSWIGTYGSHGFGIYGDAISYPEFASVNVQNALQWIWAGSTADSRALQKSAAPSSRIAATWYSGTNFTVDVNISDTVTHPVAIYSVDWDNRGRVQTFDVLDAQTGQVLDTRQLSNFAGGQYMIWNISGHVLIRVTNNTSPNSVVSGIFF